MRNVAYFLAAAAISGLAFAATPSSASALAGGHTTLPAINEGLVQKVHGSHCKKKFSNRSGWHRHRRACHTYYRYYDDYDDYYGGYGPYYGGYPYGGYGIGVPFFSFNFGDRHRHRHHWRRD